MGEAVAATSPDRSEGTAKNVKGEVMSARRHGDHKSHKHWGGEWDSHRHHSHRSWDDDCHDNWDDNCHDDWDSCDDDD
jgi:hypothetical protein